MYIENYQALLACILNKRMSVDKAVYIMTGQQNRTHSNKKQFKVIDTKLDKEYIGEAKEVCDAIQECCCNVYKYAIEGSLYKNRYKIYHI